MNRLGIKATPGCNSKPNITICHNLSDFRCGNDFLLPLPSLLLDERRRVCGDDRILVVTGRGSRLGLAERGTDLEVRISITPTLRCFMDETLKSELQKQGVFLTSLRICTLGTQNSIWPLGFGLPVVLSR